MSRLSAYATWTADMAFAYCVLSHKNPEQVERLVTRIQELSPAAIVLVHHDPTGPALHGRAAAAQIPAAPVEWGRWSLAEAMLRCFEAARDAGAEAAVLISGQDYPIRDLQEWEAWFASLNVAAVLPALRVAPLGRIGSTPPADDRYLRAWLRWFGLPRKPRWLGALPARADAFRWKILHRLEPWICYRIVPPGRGVLGLRRLRQPFPDGYTCFWGSQWLALRADAIDEVLLTPVQRERVTRVFATSLIPDESYVHTVVLNSGLRVHHAEITFNRWSGEMGEAHPSTLTSPLLHEARHSGLPFARKFDLEAGPDLFDLADTFVEGRTSLDGRA